MATRKIATYENGSRAAVVYRDADWQEYQVRFYVAGELCRDATYHTDDKADASDTAAAFCR
jgi:hypothetical protein